MKLMIQGITRAIYGGLLIVIEQKILKEKRM
jgi:hypothetical protein